MKKTGIVFTSRNNYNLLDVWLSRVDTEGFSVLNIDEDSTEENKETGKSICEKYNVVYMDREIRGLQNNMTTTKKHFDKLGVEWVVWFQHDCFPVDEGFFTDFNKIFIKVLQNRVTNMEYRVENWRFGGEWWRIGGE